MQQFLTVYTVRTDIRLNFVVTVKPPSKVWNRIFQKMIRLHYTVPYLFLMPYYESLPIYAWAAKYSVTSVSASSVEKFSVTHLMSLAMRKRPWP